MQALVQRPNRIVWADAARVLALLMMVQGHTIDALLSPALREGRLHDVWLYCRGLTAPTFMFLSGFSFMIASLKRWDSHLSFTSAVQKRLFRFVSLIVLGYAMHLPVRSLRDFPHVDPNAWHAWLQIDVLQCIGLSLLMLQALVYLFKTPTRFAVAAGVASATVIMVTPILWATNLTAVLPEWLAAYFTGTTGSLFPPFPWAAYVFAGAALGYAYSRMPLQSVALPAAFSGVALMSVGMLINKLPFSLYSSIEYWRTSPNLFLIRLGLVFIVVGIVAWFTDRIRIPIVPTQYVAQETLIVYFIHVCILYGSIWNPGVQQYLGKSLGWSGALLFALILQISMVALAYWWHRFKRTGPQQSAFVRTAIVGMAVAYWLI